MAVGVLIVSDIALYREGLQRVLRDEPRVCVLGTASSGDAAIELVVALKPAIALVDLAMQGALITVRQVVGHRR